MSKTLKRRTKELDEREKKLKIQLETSGDEMKEKAKTVGKVALISGLVALIGYWGYNAFFSDDEDEEYVKPKKKKKKSKRSNDMWTRLSGYVTPYIVNFLDELLELKPLREEGKEVVEEKEED
ncbi:MAG: hypothetical protein AAF391_03155 [Bacteroidota bacterium]